MAYPNTIIGGAPKAGTTSLYFWLAAHPEVCASNIKETYFFDDKVHRLNEGCNVLENNLEDYEKYFSNCANHKVIFEATPTYLYTQNALKGMHMLPHLPRFIFAFRDPVSRLYSQYRYHKYKLKHFEGDFEKYVKEGGENFSSNMLLRGKYMLYLEKWINLLGKERILVLEFEMIKNEPLEAMHRVAEFLEIDPDFYKNYSFKAANPTVKIKNRYLHKMGLRLQPLIPASVQNSLIPLYHKLNTKKINTSESSREAELIAELKEVYKPFNQALEDCFPELDIAHWFSGAKN